MVYYEFPFLVFVSRDFAYTLVVMDEYSLELCNFLFCLCKKFFRFLFPLKNSWLFLEMRMVLYLLETLLFVICNLKALFIVFGFFNHLELRHVWMPPLMLSYGCGGLFECFA